MNLNIVFFIDCLTVGFSIFRGFMVRCFAIMLLVVRITHVTLPTERKTPS